MPHFSCLGAKALLSRCFAPEDTTGSKQWSEFEEELTKIEAVLTDINILASDPTLQIRARDGANWTVELGDRRRNREAGLEDAIVTPGDPVVVTGHRTNYFGEYRIKAVRLTIGKTEYALYPEEQVSAD